LTVVARDHTLERELTELAARSVGLVGDGGIGAFADFRALPGGVRPRSLEAWRREVAEELADARNYCLWWAQSVYRAMLAGESAACEEYERAMRALAGVLVAWRGLVG
jgi:hypothetical protein